MTSRYEFLSYDPCSVTITVDGMTLGYEVDSIRYERSHPEKKANAEWSPGHFVATCETTMDGAAVRDLFWRVTPAQMGVTVGTLIRRALYGGRKGRRAILRLSGR